jgi:hypothetical protein
MYVYYYFSILHKLLLQTHTASEGIHHNYNTAVRSLSRSALALDHFKAQETSSTDE